MGKPERSRYTAKVEEPITAAPAGGAGKVTPLLRGVTRFLSAPQTTRNTPSGQRASPLASRMLACTEMITMCLQSAKQKHLVAQHHHQQQQQHQQQTLHTAKQGLTIFHDVSTSIHLLIYLGEKWHLYYIYTYRKHLFK